MDYKSVGERAEKIRRRVRATNYLTVAQLFLKDNFLLERNLSSHDIKPRLLGHFGSCPGVNLMYAVLGDIFSDDKNYSFLLGPGHAFPALNANLFIDGKLTEKNIEEFCRKFSWPYGYPSHASPMTPGVIIEGGELGYALGAAYGQILGHPEKTVAVMLGDGEMETATALASLNLNKIISGKNNGKVIPILHLNGYKISGPTIMGRKSERELHEEIRGFGYEIVDTDDGDVEELLTAMEKAVKLKKPFVIFRNRKGETGPEYVNGKKVAGNFLAHQIPLPNAKSDEAERKQLEEWLMSYNFSELYTTEGGFKI